MIRDQLSESLVELALMHATLDVANGALLYTTCVRFEATQAAQADSTVGWYKLAQGICDRYKPLPSCQGAGHSQQ